MEFREYANKRVLIVDDQPDIHRDFTEMLRPGLVDASLDASMNDVAAAFMGEVAGDTFLPEFELRHAAGGEEACEIVRTAKAADRPVAVAFVDVRMPPGIDGIETARRMRETDADIEIVIMTAYTDKSLYEIIHGMESLHKLLYIRKPFSHEEIQQITLSLVGKWNMERELAEKRRQLEAVLNATGEAIAMHDDAGHLVFANQLFENLMGLTEYELKKMPPHDLTAHFQDQFREPDLSGLEGWLLLGGGNVMETTGAGQVPKQRLFYRSTAPVSDDRGEVLGSLVVYRDISKEIEAEQIKAEGLRLRAELETTHSFAGIVGTSPAMQRVYALMKQAAEGDITVLIRGESGTGKDLLAKAFHLNSPRRQGPFVAVNCAAIPETLIESELFGHERGAFTGATQRRVGAFERADGGTILLDEIGDMPHALQSKLLRVLQEREIQRVGGTAPVAIDIRVMTATNKNLELLVRQGGFRQDLFYRIAAFPIAIPPLRQRREDLPMLARHFLDKFAARADKSISGISTAALRLLLQYDWPGNVRELENAIERAVLLETDALLQPGSLPPQLSPLLAAGSDPSTPTAVPPLAEIERQALALALELAGNNVAQAARTLGINRVTLHRKLKKHNLARD